MIRTFFSLTAASALLISCSTTGEPQYQQTSSSATIEQEEASASNQEETEAKLEEVLEEVETSTETTSSTSYQGSEVRPSGLRSDAAPDYASNRVTLQVLVNNLPAEIVLELNSENAPNAVANFKYNVVQGNYNGLLFHRAIADYLIQTGDPLSKTPARKDEWGLGGPDYTIPFESNGDFGNGSVGVARLDNDVNPARANHGSQFFITIGEQPQLNGEYTVIGEVVEGLEVLTQIASVATDENNVPLRPITLTNAQLNTSAEANNSERIAWETGTVPHISASRNIQNSGRNSEKPNFVGPPNPGTWRSVINRIW